MAAGQKKEVLRQTSDEARSLAKRMLREANHAALATLEIKTGHPLASRVSMANDIDGTPLVLTSELSAHTAAMMSDPRCSLLIGQMGKGDPLAHSRMTLVCRAEVLARQGDAYSIARRRFLARHPKAELYIDFADFHIFRLNVERISLNGGFGKAYALTNSDLILSEAPLLAEFAKREANILDHMNEDHADCISHYAVTLGNQTAGAWRMSGLDPEGVDLVRGGTFLRLTFLELLTSTAQIREVLVRLAQQD